MEERCAGCASCAAQFVVQFTGGSLWLLFAVNSGWERLKCLVSGRGILGLPPL